MGLPLLMDGSHILLTLPTFFLALLKNSFTFEKKLKKNLPTDIFHRFKPRTKVPKIPEQLF
jgi:hypothetical protein